MKLYQWLLLVMGLLMLATLMDRTPLQTVIFVATWSVVVPLLIGGVRFLRRRKHA